MECKLLIYNQNPDFVVFCETWIKFNEPKFYEYKALWKNRLGSGWGGLGILIKQGIQFQKLELTTYDNGVLEFMAVRLYVESNRSLNILNVYNPNKNITFAELDHYVTQLGDHSAKYGRTYTDAWVLTKSLYRAALQKIYQPT